MPTLTCDHTFRGTNNCTKCDVHVSVLTLEGRVEAMELTLSVLGADPAPISGRTMFERLTRVEKELQKVLSLAGRVKLAELAEEMDGASEPQKAYETRVNFIAASEEVEKQFDRAVAGVTARVLAEARGSDRVQTHCLLGEVMEVLQHEFRVLTRTEDRTNYQLDCQRLESLILRVRRVSVALNQGMDWVSVTTDAEQSYTGIEREEGDDAG